MKKMKTALCAATVGCIVIGSVFVGSAAKTPYINKTSANIYKGNTVNLKIYNAGGKVKWSSSNKKVAKITSISGKVNGRAKIKGIKAGKATITAKLKNGKKLKCKITVKIKPSTGGTTVYITNTGDKYHTYNCRFLRSSKIAVSLSWAQSHGYQACSVCH